MPSIQRPLSGDSLHFRIEEELERTGGDDALEKHGRVARTLAKDGPLRLTLVVLAPGGELEEHRAPGPVTIQPLEGEVRLSTMGEHQDLKVGDLLVLGPGVPHAVSSSAGGAFLLTVVHPAAVESKSGEDAG